MRVTRRDVKPSPIPFFVILMLIVFVIGVIYLYRQRAYSVGNSAPQPTGVTQKLWEDGKIYGGLPRAQDAEHQYELLRRMAYVDGYSETYKDPLWSSYHLHHVNVEFHDSRERLKFHPDAETSAQADARDYGDSGYDRGHMCPNHAIDAVFGSQAQEQTFLMSNVVPQKHNLNAGPWEELERYELETAQEYQEDWVMCGPVFRPPVERLPAGEAIPAACWKVLVREAGGRPMVLAFEMPQDTPKRISFTPFQVSVKKIELDTGLSFFDALGPQLKSQLETELLSEWPVQRE